MHNTCPILALKFRRFFPDDQKSLNSDKFVSTRTSIHYSNTYKSTQTQCMIVIANSDVHMQSKFSKTNQQLQDCMN